MSVSYLSVLLQNLRGDPGISLNKLEQRIFCDFASRRCEIHQGFEAGIGFAENGVSETGHHLAGFEGFPEKVFDVSVAVGTSELGFHSQDISKCVLSC